MNPYDRTVFKLGVDWNEARGVGHPEGGEATLNLYPDKRNDALLAWMERNAMRTLAIITSTNPQGEPEDSATNHELWLKLVDAAKLNGFFTDDGDYVSGPAWAVCYSYPGCGDQEYEMHAAIANMEKSHARMLAERFEQASFMFIDASVTNPVCELVVLL